jgi:TonB family protein
MRRMICATVIAFVSVAGVAGTPAAEARGGRFFSRSDGGVDRALLLRRFSAEVTTAPGTVRSHVTVEVAAPTDGEAEAIMRLPVPRGAAVTSAVLWVNGRPMNGMFVEQQRATDVYRSIVERRRDPALVTWSAPGWVAVSIFPLEHRQPRRFELEWVEPAAVAGGRVQYRVPAIFHRSRLIARASLAIDGRKRRGDDRDTISIAAAGAPIVAGRAPGDPFHQVLVRGAAPAGAPRFALVAETSAAMDAGGRARQRAAMDALLAALPAGARATIVAADRDVYVIAEEAAASRWPRALARVDAIGSAGALDLVGALRDAAARARAAGGDAVVFVGRGWDSLGHDLVRALVPELGDAGVRLFFIDTGPAGGQPPLRDAARLTGGDAVSEPSLGAALPSLVRALRPRPDPPVLPARATGQWRLLDTVTGQAVWLTRVLDPPAGFATTAARPTDLTSLWNRARFADGVLSPTTALLVLETEEDYERFGLAEAAPDSPSVSGSLVGTADDDAADGAWAVSAVPPPTVLPVRRARAPEVIAGMCYVRGSLDKEIIRRIIRRHINEVRYCYEQELTKQHTLQGRVTLRLTIAPSGRVAASEVSQSTLGNDPAESCIAAAARGWQFPAPEGGGPVEVTYPFVLVPAARP